MYLREINKFLALVCILREYNFSRQGVIDYNFLCFRDAIHKVFEVRTTKPEALADSSFDDEYDGDEGEDDEDDDDHDDDNHDGDDDDDEDEDDEDDDDDDLDNKDARSDVRRSLRLHRYTSDEEEEHQYPRPSIVING